MAAKKTQTPAQVRATQKRKVVAMRDNKKNPASWAEIAEAIGTSPKKARTLYDEVKGAGAHHGLLPGKGGRQVAQAA